MKKILLSLIPLLAASMAHAQEAAHAATGGGDKLYIAIGAGLVLGLAGFGCGLGQGKVGGAAMDGIARNPQAGDKMFTSMIIALAFIEAIAIYAFVIAILMYGKI